MQNLASGQQDFCKILQHTSGAHGRIGRAWNKSECGKIAFHSQRLAGNENGDETGSSNGNSIVGERKRKRDSLNLRTLNVNFPLILRLETLFRLESSKLNRT